MRTNRTIILISGILILALSLGMVAVGGATWIGYATQRDANGLIDQLGWDLSSGDLSVVVTESDGSSGVALEVTSAVRSVPTEWLGFGLVLVGLVLGAVGIALVVRGRPETPEAGTSSDPPVPDGPPVRVEGRLDPDVSRWTWMVKWVLAIPHVLVLALLWPVFVILTVVAFFAILATGRYPRSIFDVNLGILRWTWRVGFYAFAAIGTDRYPPFTLADADYPARLDVAYPTTLSRGLVLIKSWLLALPHLIVVGVLTSGIVWQVYEPVAGGASLRIGGGVIGTLVLVAGVALLVTGRYPAPLFDLLVGLNRWVYRVVVYIALMRDEYPPFRLDLGGSEPRPQSDRPTPDAPPPSAPARTP